MNKKTLSLTIVLLSLAGVLFSGYLSYVELFANASSCGVTRQATGIPTCVYGFAMFTLILIFSTLLAIKNFRVEK